MDDFTTQHLHTWLEREILDAEERFEAWSDITDFIREYPHVLEDLGGRSWREILDLSRREL